MKRELAPGLALALAAAALAQPSGAPPTPSTSTSARPAQAQQVAPAGGNVATLSRAEVGGAAFHRARILQPRLHLDGVASGIRSLWDRSEAHPPMSFRTRDGWDPRVLGTDLDLLASTEVSHPDGLEFWSRRGAVYYHDLLEPRPEGTDLLHRFFFVFLRGRDLWNRTLAPHVVWVEVRERLNPDESQLEARRARARGELESSLIRLRGLAAAAPEAGLQPQVARIEALLAGEVPVPLHLGITEVVISDPVSMLEGGIWRLRRYGAEQLSFYGERLELYVSGGNHRMVVDLSELGFLEECDMPGVLEPREGKLSLVDLRFQGDKENPIQARSQGQEVPEMPGFLDNLPFLVGFREAARLEPELFEGRPYPEDPPEPSLEDQASK